MTNYDAIRNSLVTDLANPYMAISRDDMAAILADLDRAVAGADRTAAAEAGEMAYAHRTWTLERELREACGYQRSRDIWRDQAVRAEKMLSRTRSELETAAVTGNWIHVNGALKIARGDSQ